MKKIWVNGTFDILHIGHILLLEHASNLGIVRVGLDTDERVKDKKGKDRPFNCIADRIHFMKSIRYVDSVVSFSTNQELIDRIREWEPDIMVIGDDYEYHEIIGIEYIPKVEFFQKIKELSTSKILKNEKK